MELEVKDLGAWYSGNTNVRVRESQIIQTKRVVDWEKVKTLDDVKRIMMALSIAFFGDAGDSIADLLEEVIEQR